LLLTVQASLMFSSLLVVAGLEVMIRLAVVAEVDIFL